MQSPEQQPGSLQSELSRELTTAESGRIKEILAQIKEILNPLGIAGLGEVTQQEYKKLDPKTRQNLMRLSEKLERLVKGESNWSYESEEFTPEKLEQQYNEQIKMYQDLGIITELSNGQEGIIDIEGNEHPTPTYEQIFELVQEQQEVLTIKVEQGFTELLIVPDTYSLDKFIDKTKQNILDHKQAGKLFATKKDPDNPNEPLEPLELDEAKPLWAWSGHQNADEFGELIYYPEKYDQTNHNGKTKKQMIKEQRTIPGWRLLLIEDLPNIPRATTDPIEISQRTKGGRRQLEAGIRLRDYLAKIQTDSIYQNEVLWTPEDWLAYFNYRLVTTNQVIDDYLGAGSVRGLGAAYFPDSDDLAGGYWSRDSRRAGLDRYDPGGSGSVGSASAVRVN